MRSKQAYEALLEKGYPVDKCGYNQNDALESNDDLETLMDMLLKLTNKRGQHPVITMNAIMTNPDFEKIKEHGYNWYFSEPFTKTLERYEGREQVMKLYKKGIRLGVFRPQLHGREHVNIGRWMIALQNGVPSILEAFYWNMFSVHAERNTSYPMEYMDALAPQNKEDNDLYKLSIEEAATLFKSFFGYSSETFIAPCFIWDSSLQPTLRKVGIKGIQGMFYQNQPTYSVPKYKTKYHYCGQNLGNGQYYIMRNVTFEPALNPNKDCVEGALSEIDLAFKWKRPAIISSHRVNYIGSIHPENRENGLKQLKGLLKQVIKKYPDVEFMSSDQLLNEFKING